MKSTNTVIIHGWMINELKLKGNDLVLFAVIYGFSQDGMTKYTGSLKYLSGAIASHKNTVINSLNSLIDLGYIIKESFLINNITFCNYFYNELVVQNLVWGGTKFVSGGGTNFGINNTILNNTNIEKDFLSFFEKLSDEKKKSFLKKISLKENTKKIVFSECIYSDYEKLRNLLKEDLEFVSKFKSVDLKHYIFSVDAWSESSQTNRTERGWLMTLRKWMNDDLNNHKLVKIETPNKPKGHTNH